METIIMSNSAKCINGSTKSSGNNNWKHLIIFKFHNYLVNEVETQLGFIERGEMMCLNELLHKKYNPPAYSQHIYLFKSHTTLRNRRFWTLEAG